jgi:hypothetical protein
VSWAHRDAPFLTAEPAGVIVDEPSDATAINTSECGASLADLMARMGHDSPDAAMTYQHATRQADRAIAAAVSAEVESARGGSGSTETRGRGR